MSKKTVFGVIGGLALIASIVMYKVGSSSSHLSELKDFWWMPLPLAVICFLVAASSKPKA
jgi:CDP-diglyceride synthetase